MYVRIRKCVARINPLCLFIRNWKNRRRKKEDKKNERKYKKKVREKQSPGLGLNSIFSAWEPEPTTSLCVFFKGSFCIEIWITLYPTRGTTFRGKCLAYGTHNIKLHISFDFYLTRSHSLGGAWQTDVWNCLKWPQNAISLECSIYCFVNCVKWT